MILTWRQCSRGFDTKNIGEIEHYDGRITWDIDDEIFCLREFLEKICKQDVRFQKSCVENFSSIDKLDFLSKEAQEHAIKVKGVQAVLEMKDHLDPELREKYKSILNLGRSGLFR